MGDSAVQDALNHLQDVMNNAANNDPDALTADIESATKAVQDAMNAAKSDRDAVTTDANNLIGKVAPISNEPGVAEALQNLQDALNGTTTGSDIRDATTKLQQALDAANAARTQPMMLASEQSLMRTFQRSPLIQRLYQRCDTCKM